ncbi:MAG: sensor histidine kinase [Eubacteriales bacterium]|nr:sensor histidine kinase [Eubacteriales bacterium]
MKKLSVFLRQNWGVFAAFCIVCACFAAVLPLYNVPAEAVLYAAALTAAGWGVIGAVRLAAARQRRRELEQVRAHLASSLDGLPEPASPTEEEYARLLSALWELRRQELSRAEAADTERRDAFTLWAHQIKTPIAAARLLLQSGGDPDALAEQLFFIEQYAEMALASLRSETMAGDILIRRTPLGKLARGAAKKFARSFYLRGLSLHFDIPETLSALTDEKWMTFVTEQLLSNAVKYTPSGGCVTVSGTLEDGCPVLRIADTGIGIRPEDLPRIFERGFTGFNGRADKKATGLGLYLCRRVTGALGVELGIESAPGRGTCAVLRFPASVRLDE